ncbi:MAG: LytR/AlgR family response regulator transcription factor [Candidatus Weimeria sp.]
MKNEIIRKIAVCDDEQYYTKKLREDLKRLSKDYEIDEYHSAKELLEAGKSYDIVFLDIEMPEMNGLETALRLRDIMPDIYIIFLTSYIDFAIDAYRVKAFRYLIKNGKIEELEEAMQAIEQEIAGESFVEANNGSRVRVSDITYFEARHNGCYIHLRNGDEAKSGDTLAKIQKMLGDDDFCQVSRSIIVAYHYIRCVNNDKIIIEGLDACIPVPRKKIKIVRDQIDDYFRKHLRQL